MERQQTNLFIHIADGYSFRNMLGIVKNEVDKATMILSKDTIEISFANLTKCAVHKIVLYTKEFTVYSYDVKEENGELAESHPLAFDTNELFNTTKGIGKKDAIRIFWIRGEDQINVQPLKQSTKDNFGRSGSLFVKIKTMEHKRYELMEYPAEPNIRVLAKEFADLCNQVGGIKGSFIQMTGHTNGVTFKGMKPNLTVGSLVKFSQPTNKIDHVIKNGQYLDDLINAVQNSTQSSAQHSDTIAKSTANLDLVNADDISVVKIPMSSVKALSKIHNISPPGTLLRFFFVAGKPAKMESPIGCFGSYTICIRN